MSEIGLLSMEALQSDHGKGIHPSRVTALAYRYPWDPPEDRGAASDEPTPDAFGHRSDLP